IPDVRHLEEILVQPCFSNGLPEESYGYSTEYQVARYYRDAPPYAMVEGSHNICKLIIAQDQLGIRKANK
ncbi:MAG: acyl-CoA dehydrogenase family protein, partial [Desulfatiglandales bacterium]